MLPKLCGTASGKARSHHRRRVLLRSHYELLAVAIAQAVCSSEPQSSRRGAPLQVVPVRAVVMLPVRFGAAPVPATHLLCLPDASRAIPCRPVSANADGLCRHHSRHLRRSISTRRASSKGGRRRQSRLGLRWTLCCARGRLVDRSRRFRSADCREKSRCVTAEDLVPRWVVET